MLLEHVLVTETRSPCLFRFATQWLKAHQASSSEELVERVLRGEDAIYREFTAFVTRGRGVVVMFCSAPAFTHHFELCNCSCTLLIAVYKWGPRNLRGEPILVHTLHQ